MARLAVGVVGAAVGFYLGGPAGASIGWSLGAAAGGFLFPESGPNVEGARLDDLRVMGSSYGVPIPICYGAMRVPGQVIWATNLREIRTEEDVGGKGGPSATQVSYRYTGTFAVALCEGPIAAVTRVWANGQCVYDVRNPANTEALVASGNWVAVSGMRVYLGTESQLPDPAIEAAQGVGTTPAFRGLAYVVFENLPLDSYGNALPRQLDFEVTTGASLGPAVYAVSGSVVSPIWPQFANTRGALPVLQVGEGIIQTAGANGQLDRAFAVSGQQVGAGGAAPMLGLKGLPAFLTGLWGAVGITSGGRAIYVKISGFDTWPFDTNWELRLDGISGFNLRPLVGAPANSRFRHAAPSADRRQLLVAYRDLDAGADCYAIVDLTGPSGPVRSGVGTFPPAGVVCGFAATSNNVLTYQYGGDSAFVLDSDGFLWIAWSAPGEIGVWLYDVSTSTASAIGALTLPGDATRTAIGIDAANGVAAVAAGSRFHVLSRLPTSTVTAPTLQAVVTGLCARSGLSAGQIDVSLLSGTVDGVAYTRGGSGRSLLDSLRAAYWFDAVESGDKIRFVPRGGAPVAALTLDDLAAADDGAAIASEREHDDALPERVAVAYAARDSDYRVGSQLAVRGSLTADALRTVELPLALSDARAAQAAQVALADAWMGRTARRLTLMPRHAAIEPTDVIDLTDAARTARLRVVRKSEVLADSVRLECVDEDAALYSPAATAGTVASTGNSPALAGPTRLEVLDLPPLRDADNDGGYYLAIAGYTSAWRGGVVARSNDAGQSWAEVAAASPPGAIVGAAATALAAHPGGNTFDEAAVLDVSVSPTATLASATEAQVLAGANAALVGSELIGFKNASLLAAGSYRLTGLLRGRKGTPQTGHAVGERFVLLTTGAIVSVPGVAADAGRALTWRAQSVGAPATDPGQQVALIYTAARLRPLPPVALAGTRLPNGDVSLRWVRCGRIDTEWRDGVDVPLNEASESYEVEILNAGATAVLRTLTGLTTPAATYTAANQTTDFGSAPGTLNVRVYQISAAVGRGTAAAAALVVT